MNAQGLEHALRAADAAIRSGRRDEARKHWEGVLAGGSEQPVALNGLGMIAMAEGRAEEATILFRRAASADPGVVHLWLNAAHAARAAGDDAMEGECLHRAVVAEPASLAAHARLAELAERRGDETAAGASWSRVVAIAPAVGDDPPETRAVVGRARRFLERQTATLAARVDAALAHRREAIAPLERRRVDAAIDHALGRRAIYLNHCSGLHLPFLAAEEWFDRHHFPWLTELEAATDAIRAELALALGAGREGFEPYVALPAGTPPSVWAALDRSRDWDTLHLWRHGVRDAAICDRFPRTAAVLERLPLAELPGRMPTVFFSILAPGTHIPPHTGVTNARTIVHLPLIVPPGCRLRVGGETREWIEGRAFAFDDTIEHEAWNDSDRPRAVLILDVWNPYLTPVEREMIAAFYAADPRGAIVPGTLA